MTEDNLLALNPAKDGFPESEVAGFRMLTLALFLAWLRFRPSLITVGCGFESPLNTDLRKSLKVPRLSRWWRTGKGMEEVWMYPADLETADGH